MTAKAALCIALLRGDVISIMSCFKDIGITNCPREVGRCIEKPFGVTVSRTRKEGISRWGTPCTWFQYRLNRTEMNAPGIEKMKEYVRQQLTKEEQPKTQQEVKRFQQIEMALKY